VCAQSSPNGATSIRFSTDGKTLHVGSHDVDAATGAVTAAEHAEGAPSARDPLGGRIAHGSQLIAFPDRARSGIAVDDRFLVSYPGCHERVSGR